MKNQEQTWLLKEKYQGMESEAFRADCDRLSTGVPLGYLIGHVPFLDCTIHLDSHPLIPRPETEYWVERSITAIKSSVLAMAARQSTHNNTKVDCHVSSASAPPPRKDDRRPISNLRGRTPKILDLCAGSGAIGIAVSKAIPEADVTFAELDPAHLPTIEKNLVSNVSVNRNIGEEVTSQIIVSDLFSNFSVETKFDYILTNPPYIDPAANTVDNNVTEHEPHLALFGGIDGMELIARIISEAPAYLTPQGQLWLEHEPAQVEAISSLALANGFTLITHPDQYGVARFSVLTMAQ